VLVCVLVLGVDCKGQALYGGKIEVRKVRLAELQLFYVRFFSPHGSSDGVRMIGKVTTGAQMQGPTLYCPWNRIHAGYDGCPGEIAWRSHRNVWPELQPVRFVRVNEYGYAMVLIRSI